MKVARTRSPGADRARRSLLLRASSLALLSLAAPLGGPAVARAAIVSPPDPRPVGPTVRRMGGLSPLAERLARHPEVFQRRADGSLESVFGVALAEARLVFFPASRGRALPAGYVPPDLSYRLSHPLRSLAVPEFGAMFDAAERAGAYLAVVSGYRSTEYQAGVFEAAVERQLAQNESIDRPEAERRAARFVAPPGHSQHQLGTTADLSSWEIGFAIRATFAETVAGRWVLEHAWEHGFVLPYTTAAEPRTGYVPEPWHVRWVGRQLAALLWEEKYLGSSQPTADDWLLALEELLAREAPGTVGPQLTLPS